jgi:hypothetical protein
MIKADKYLPASFFITTPLCISIRFPRQSAGYNPTIILGETKHKESMGSIEIQSQQEFNQSILTH